MNYCIRYTSVSHTGYIRKVNQDSIVCENQHIDDPYANGYQKKDGYIPIKKASVFGVFDGMGGLSNGEIASSITAKCIAKFNFETNPILKLKDLCVKANKEICEFAKKNNLGNMGTTAAVLVFSRQGISLCNIGDSKIYRLGDGCMEQISKDHTEKCSWSNNYLLTQNLGIREEELKIRPYLAEGYYQVGDIYLICSDGLTDMISQESIKEIILKVPFEQASQELLKKALEAGGKDNISLVMCKIEKRNFFITRKGVT